MNEYKPKHSKPGKKPKSAKIWNKKVRLHDIDKPPELICSYCNTYDLTCRPCHPEDDYIKFELGGGKAIGEKTDDDYTSLLCDKCDKELSTKPPKDSSELTQLRHTWKWSKAIMRDMKRRLSDHS